MMPALSICYCWHGEIGAIKPSGLQFTAQCQETAGEMLWEDYRWILVPWGSRGRTGLSATSLLAEVFPPLATWDSSLRSRMTWRERIMTAPVSQSISPDEGTPHAERQ